MSLLAEASHIAIAVWPCTGTAEDLRQATTPLGVLIPAPVRLEFPGATEGRTRPRERPGSWTVTVGRPRTLEEMVTLPGVGRKTANVVLGNAFGIPGITVDTHFGRLARRFGWTTNTDPEKVEQDVAALFPRKEWTMLSHRLIWHGRRICHAQRPACGACALARLCPSYGEGPIDPVVAAKLVRPGPFS